MTSLDAEIATPIRFVAWRSHAPGLVLTAAIAATAFALRLAPGVALLSPMILAVIIGVVVHNFVGAPPATRDGVAFSLRRILRLSIVLLGLQITAREAMGLGATGLATIVVALSSTLAFSLAAGRVLRVERGLALLIGVGTSICGASAVLAAKAATGGEDDDAAYAVACVTLFGTLAMFAYPLAESLLHLPPGAYGLWSGASIHEIAQAVAAAFQDGDDAGRIGAIAKLSRVAMMAPVVIAIGEFGPALGLAGEGERSRPPFPWFLLGFLALAALNSVVAIPAAVSAPVAAATTFLLSMAMAAMGLQTDLGHLRSRGLRPLALGLLASLFISLVSLVMVRLSF